MMILLRSSRFFMAKKSMSDAFKYFLEHDAFASVRREPHQKDRKYANVEIVQQFKREEEIRKKQRLEHIKARKKLLEQKLTTESKLLTNQQDEELKSVNEQITSLQTLLEAQQRQLANLNAKLQETEADMILVEGHRKIVVLNKITYLKHLNYHPSGLVLHPEVMKTLENVHYLVNNNLPVNKYKLFETMPQIFETEINELEESMKKLIEEKKLDPDSEPSSRIRFFMKHKARFRDPEQDIIDLQDKRDEIYHNMELEIVRMIEPHMGYIKLVDAGHTPFRNTEHMIHVMLSDQLNLKLTLEEEALKQAIKEVVELKEQFTIYNEEVNEQFVKLRHKYIEPPEWIKNHPVLLERYEKIMVKWMNPQPVLDQLPNFPPRDDGWAYLQEKLRALAVEKYHPMIEALWNEGRKEELVAKKKELQISFYKEATEIHEEYLEMIADNEQKEEFLKISKKPRELAEQKHASITLDDLTKSIFINNTNPGKYNLEFFTKYLGLENPEETRKLFNSFSYLRVSQQAKPAPEDLKYQVLKFKA